MDLKLLDAEPTDARARGDRPPPRSGAHALGGRRALARRGGSHGAARATMRARGGICSCRRCTRCRSTPAGSARARLNYVCERLDVPPADAYGVATFYALLSPSSRARRASCTCARTSPAAATDRRTLIAELEERVGAGGRGRRRRRPGSAARASASATGRPRRCSRVAGEEPSEQVLAPVTADEVLDDARRSTTAEPAVEFPSHARSSETRACGCCGASATCDPTSLDDYRAHGGYAALRRAMELGPDGVHPRGQGLEAPRPRRRRVPDRASSGRRWRGSRHGRTT